MHHNAENSKSSPSVPTPTKASPGMYLEKTSNTTSASATQYVVNIDVTETVYQTTAIYQGISTEEFLTAVDEEIAIVNQTIANATDTIITALNDSATQVGELMDKSLEIYAQAVTNSTEALANVVKLDAQLIQEEIGMLVNNTNKDYKALVKQLKKNLNETIILKEMILEDNLQIEEEYLHELLDEIAQAREKLNLTSDPTTTSSSTSNSSTTSSCSSYTDCYHCVQDSGCGWCVFENSCVQGDYIGPTLAICSYYDFQTCSVSSTTTSSSTSSSTTTTATTGSSTSTTEVEVKFLNLSFMRMKYRPYKR